MLTQSPSLSKLLGITFLQFLFISHLSFAQTGVADTPASLPGGGLMNFREKVYVQTDKSFYLPGEIIWFKVYCLDQATNKLAEISKEAYIEILDRQNTPLLQANVALENGTGCGSFMVPVTVNSDNYMFRAYTNWMKNFGPDLYFQKKLTIVNPAKKPIWPSPQKVQAEDVQFFPEGGDLVNGMQSKVAFRVVDRQGKGLDCAGYILSQNNDIVARFHSLHVGLGSFYFTPLSGYSYKAVFMLENKLTSTSLPKAREQGYVMHLSDNGENLSITVNNNTAENTYKTYLVISKGLNIITTKEVKAIGSKSTFVLPKNSLSDGISTFTILNTDHQPVCERLYFKRPEKQSLAELNTSRLVYNPREIVNVALQVFDTTSAVRQGSYSMSVYLVDSLQRLQEEDIRTYLLLSSELNGTIESPGYYLNNTGSDINDATDNLMLTHGWRRFVNNESKTEHSKYQFLPEYEGQILKAKVLNKQTLEPVANVMAYLSVPGEKFIFTNAVSNKDGDLGFLLKDFYGSVQAVVQTNSLQDSNYNVVISNQFSDTFSTGTLPPFELSARWKEQLTARYISSQVQNSFAAADLQKFSLPAAYDSTAFFGTPDKKYFLDDYTRFPTMEEVLHEYVSDVIIRKQGDNFRIVVRDIPYQNNFEQAPLILLDGVPVFDINKIVAFDPLKIKKLEVMARKYYLGSLLSSGILSYSTYGGDLAGYELDPNATITDLQGTQIKREFFTPVYDTDDKLLSPVADARNVLLWSPEITASAGGKKNISFYTSDLPGSYAVVLQGIDGNGQPVSSIKMITVKK